MEISIPFSIFLSAMCIIATLAIFATKVTVKLDRSLSLAEVNDKRMSNPEKSGIGTSVTNTVIEHLTTVMEDIKDTNKDQSNGLLEVIRSTNDHIIESTKATQELITLIKLKIP